MNSLEEYLNRVLKDIDVSPEAKQDLYDEFLDHLEQLRKDYVAEGAQDEHAIKLAIADFGESNLVGDLINKTVAPYKKILRILLWIFFTSYALFVVYQQLLNPWRRALRFSEQPPPNLIPFYTILQHASDYQRYSFDTWFINFSGNMLIFIPLGFLLPCLFAKARHYSKTIVWTMLVSLTIELTQLGARLGSCDIDDFILNMLGGSLGYALWIIAATGWRITSQKLRPTIK